MYHRVFIQNYFWKILPLQSKNAIRHSCGKRVEMNTWINKFKWWQDWILEKSWQANRLPLRQWFFKNAKKTIIFMVFLSISVFSSYFLHGLFTWLVRLSNYRWLWQTIWCFRIVILFFSFGLNFSTSSRFKAVFFAKSRV